MFYRSSSRKSARPPRRNRVGVRLERLESRALLAADVLIGEFVLDPGGVLQCPSTVEVAVDRDRSHENRQPCQEPANDEPDVSATEGALTGAANDNSSQLSPPRGGDEQARPLNKNSEYLQTTESERQEPTISILLPMPDSLPFRLPADPVVLPSRGLDGPNDFHYYDRNARKVDVAQPSLADKPLMGYVTHDTFLAMTLLSVDAQDTPHDWLAANAAEKIRDQVGRSVVASPKYADYENQLPHDANNSALASDAVAVELARLTLAADQLMLNGEYSIPDVTKPTATNFCKCPVQVASRNVAVSSSAPQPTGSEEDRSRCAPISGLHFSAFTLLSVLLTARHQSTLDGAVATPRTVAYKPSKRRRALPARQ